MNVAKQALKMIEALQFCPEPHAFLIVVKFDRFTAEEISVLDILRISFGEQCFKHAIVVVTHVENDVSDEKFNDACREATQVNDLLKLCGDRVVRIDNKELNTGHVDNILRYIDKVSKNGRICFKNEYQLCYNKVLKRSADLNRYDNTIPHEEMVKIAKDISVAIKIQIGIEKEEKKQREQRERAERERQASSKLKETLATFAGGAVAAAVVGWVLRFK